MTRQCVLSVALVLSATVAQADDLVGDADRDFVGTVNQQCLFASLLAGAAANQGATAAIKAHGDAAVVRQAGICTELKRLADKWQIGTPGTLLRPFSEEYDRTVGLSGPPFDQAYRMAMAKADAAQAEAAAAEARSGANPELRGFATGRLTEVLRTDMVPEAVKP